MKAIKDKSWYARRNFSRLPDTIPSTFLSLILPRSMKPRFGLHLSAAPVCWSHIGPLFQRLWALAYWRQQSLRLFLLRKMRAQAIKKTRLAPEATLALDGPRRCRLRAITLYKARPLAT